jgi:hypothetical protein
MPACIRTIFLIAQLGCASSTAAVQQPPLGAVTRLGDMTQGRALHTATLLPDGQVLITGGMGPSGAIRAAELYDPSCGTTHPASPMSAGRMGHDAATGAFHPVTGAPAALRLFPTATTLADGSVLITGGHSGRGPQATVWRYRP